MLYPTLRDSAHWGASCPRQGSELPPIVVLLDVEPSSGLKVSGPQASPHLGRQGEEGFMSSLDNLRKAARRWLKALRVNDPAARARLERAVPAAPASPVLRDVQHALAREHGHDSWLDLKRAVGDRGNAARSPDVAQFEQLAADFLAAWQSGDPTALRRLAAYFRHMVTWEQLRAEVDRQLSRLPESERPAGGLTLTDVHRFLAKAAG